MGERTEALAGRFEQANNDLIKTVESTSDAQWRAACSGEGWAVGVTAHHVAGGHEAISGLAQMVAKGQPLPALTPEILDQGNAQHAAQFVNCTKVETVDLLRRNGETAAASVRVINDEELSKTGSFFGGQMSTEQVIENILIGHVQQHLASIQAAL